jgi:peptidoglycan/LPS O-acetylase OafA/YrhL
LLAELTASGSLKEKLEAAGNRPSGFDYLRIILAVSVLFWHSFGISYGREWTDTVVDSPLRPLISFILPGFFALSGFLVAGSLERSSLTTFVGLRVIRIMPALTVETLVSAIIIGPILTSFSLGDYFSDPQFRRYLLNIIGHIHYTLPGLFETNPIPNVVNGQLWTVPWELKCYIALFLLALFGLAKNRRLFLLFGVLLPIIYVVFTVFSLGENRELRGLEQITGRCLLLSFLVGVFFYKFRDVIPHSGIAVVSSLILYTMMLYWKFGEAFICIPAAYITVYFGVLNPKKISLLNRGDYSYGIFLYGFAIQQMFAGVSTFFQDWYTNFAASFVVTAMIAVVSWHYVEKPALALRKYFGRIDALVTSMKKFAHVR